MKQYTLTRERREGNVAPRAGAWIETHIHSYLQMELIVAPRAGAWIETYQYVQL